MKSLITRQAKSKSKSTLIAKSSSEPAVEHTPPRKATSPALSPSPAEDKSLSLETENVHEPPAAVPVSPSPPPPPAPASSPTFESLYLQAVTREFADDIDKVRNAGDFKESSLPILIEALRQGAGMYGQEERERVMRTATGSGS